MPGVDVLERLPTPVFRPGEPEFEAATSVWGRPRDTEVSAPRAVARPSSVEEVRAVVTAVRDAGLDVAVRGTGHHLAGSSVATDGVVVDMSAFTAIRVTENSVLRVGAGCNWGSVAAAARELGGAVPAGNEPSTGVVGLALGGGVGPLTRSFGLTCDRIRSVGMVDAEATFRRIDTSDQELLAVLRGAGRGAGIVVDVELELVAAPPRVPAAQVVYAAPEPGEILARWFDAADRCSLETNPQVTLRTLPDTPGWPPEARGRPAAVVGAVFTGDSPAAAGHLARFRDLGPVVVDHSGDAPLVEPARPWRFGLGAVSTAHFLGKVSEPTIRRLSQLVEDAPQGATLTVRALGGAVREVDPASSVFAHRAADHLVIAQAEWTDPAGESAARAWRDRADRVLGAIGSIGIYGNFCSELAEFPDLRSAAYGDVRRIDRVLRRVDPDGFFRRSADRP